MYKAERELTKKARVIFELGMMITVYDKVIGLYLFTHCSPAQDVLQPTRIDNCVGTS